MPLRLLAYALPLSLTGLARLARFASVRPLRQISLAERLECPRYREFCGKRRRPAQRSKWTRSSQYCTNATSMLVTKANSVPGRPVPSRNSP